MPRYILHMSTRMHHPMMDYTWNGVVGVARWSFIAKNGSIKARKKIREYCENRTSHNICPQVVCGIQQYRFSLRVQGAARSSRRLFAGATFVPIRRAASPATQFFFSPHAADTPLEPVSASFVRPGSGTVSAIVALADSRTGVLSLFLPSEATPPKIGCCTFPIEVNTE